MKTSLSLLTAVCLSALPAARASEAPDAIAKLGGAYIEAFNRGDSAAVAGFWLPNGTYTAPDGKVTAGRKAIQALFQSFFAENKGLQLAIDSESLQLVSPDVAIESGTTTVVPAKGGVPSSSRFSNTWVRTDGQWLLASVAESELPPADRSTELAPLAWLLGPWEARAKSGEKILLNVEPGPQGNYLVISRAIVTDAAQVAGGTEWIAWDPANKIIRSWSFDDDGGFGESRWSPSGDGFSLESQHTLRNGTVLNEMQSITRSEGGKVTVKSLKLTSGDAVVAPAEDLVFTRPKQ